MVYLSIFLLALQINNQNYHLLNCDLYIIKHWARLLNGYERKKVSSQELTQIRLDRIAAIDNRLHSYINSDTVNCRKYDRKTTLLYSYSYNHLQYLYSHSNLELTQYEKSLSMPQIITPVPKIAEPFLFCTLLLNDCLCPPNPS